MRQLSFLSRQVRSFFFFFSRMRNLTLQGKEAIVNVRSYFEEEKSNVTAWAESGKYYGCFWKIIKPIRGYLVMTKNRHRTCREIEEINYGKRKNFRGFSGDSQIHYYQK